jgi:hypothetical protein
MKRTSRFARQLLRWSAFAALPGVLWAAFEMYGLTMFGAQMLFFSIVHTMPPLVLAVWLAVPAGGIWLTQAAVALAWPTYRDLLYLPTAAAATFFLALSVQAALLVHYEVWSSSKVLRVPLCLVGLIASALLVRESWRSLKDLVPAAKLDASSGNA